MEKASGLEVDSRQHGLHLPQAADEPHYKPLEPDFAGDSGEYLHQHQRARAPRKIFGLRRTTFTLSTILAIVLILGIVSAISAGTCASKNGGFTGSNPPSMNAQQQSQTACPTLPNNSTTTTNSTMQPTTSCSTLGTQYTSNYSKQQFTLDCGTDFVGNDMLGVFAFRFEDCLEACASFNKFAYFSNAQCSHLTYTTNTAAFSESKGEGNCFLKNGTGQGTGSPSSSSAVIVTAS